MTVGVDDPIKAAVGIIESEDLPLQTDELNAHGFPARCRTAWPSQDVAEAGRTA